MANQPQSGGMIDGGRELAHVELKDPILGRFLRRFVEQSNTGFTNAGVSPGGQTAPPKTPDNVQVKMPGSTGEMMHVSISHSGQLNRGVRYFTEIGVNDPSFGSPIVVDHGTTRTPAPFHLPTFMDDGETRNTYYVRSYAQNPGSQPSAPYVVGGVGSPTAFQLNGATGMTLLSSTGSGTAPNTGQSAGQGLGKFQKRLLSKYGGGSK